jgi:uncharacterized repeat protein (TIGR03843 family)
MAAVDSNFVLTVLQHGEMIIKGKFMWGSNYTFLADAVYEETTLPVVYKPIRGERPLWDFPSSSLAHRETAAYLVSQALNWNFVPETIYRRKAPAGPGSVQRFVEHDPEYHYFNLNEEDHQCLRPVALFDLVINNADRKGGHILFDADHKLWLIDHGICFHVEDKLRTVVWDFADESIPEDLLVALNTFQEQLSSPDALFETLKEHLKSSEIRAMRMRVEALLEQRVFPNPHPDRRAFPWPPV